MSTSQHSFDQEELMAFLDGELPAERAAGAAQHLKQCSECQKLAAEFSQVSQTMLGWEVEEASEQVSASLGVALDGALRNTSDRPRIKKQKGFSFLGWKQLAWTGGLAVATLLVFAFIGTSRLRNEKGMYKFYSAVPTRAEDGRQQAAGSPQPEPKSPDKSIFVADGDFVQKYKVTTKKFGPEYGRNNGAVINTVTKSGTIVAHGSLHSKKIAEDDSFTATTSLETSGTLGARDVTPPAPLALPSPSQQANIAGNSVNGAYGFAPSTATNSWQQRPRGPAVAQNQLAQNQNDANIQLRAKAVPPAAKLSAKPDATSETVEVTADSAQIATAPPASTTAAPPASATAAPPMIIRTAQLAVTSKDFDTAHDRVEKILKRHQGYVGELTVNSSAGAARSLTGTLRVPATQLESTLDDLKAMGRVDHESLGGEEVTQQYVDLEARIKNSRNTEQRLIELQRERTGKLADVLSVEKEITRVRGEIEQMEAERKSMRNQVDYATVNLTITEDYKAELKVVPTSTGTLIRNAAVDGYKSLVDGLLGLLLWLLSWLPSLLVWIVALFFPARFVWRRLRQRFVQQEVAA